MPISRRVLLVAAVLAAPCAARLSAQQSEWDVRRNQISRDSLQSLLRNLTASANSPVYSAKLRRRSAMEAAMIEARLRDGDFQVGDRIALFVEGQAPLTDTFAVDVGRVLNLPDVGTVPLAGVLRGELTDTLRRYISRVTNTPVVRVRSLIRVTILGEVGRPGYYLLPPETLVEDALMRAGGPTGTAMLDRIRVERAGDVLWDGDALRRAMSEGRTLNGLSIRAGDTIIVPVKPKRDLYMILRTVGVLTSLPFAILGLTRLF